MTKNIEKELTHMLFVNREYERAHPDYSKELSFYSYVQEGNIPEIEKALSENPALDDATRGTLSDNPKRNVLYHFIVTVAMITRFCMEGGMDPETAYSLSDLYIHKADLAASYEEILVLHKQAIYDFSGRMKVLHKKQRYSKHIIQALDYIYNHLHQPIPVVEIADAVSLNETYLSKLFKKETGESIASYIRKKRVETACNMLRFSDYSYIDIANYLAFTSHSHFIQVFRSQTGMTPKEYRDRFYESGFTLPEQ